MARPRIFKVGEGEIRFHGFTREKSDELISLLNSEPVQTEQKLNVETTGLNETDDLIFGWNKNETTGKYELVHIRYNSTTKQARVESVLEFKTPAEVKGKFKLMCFVNQKV